MVSPNSSNVMLVDDDQRIRGMLGQFMTERGLTVYEAPDGKRMVTAVEGEERQAGRGGLKRSFIVFDALGGQYDSGSASPAGQAHLERMWEESA